MRCLKLNKYSKKTKKIRSIYMQKNLGLFSRLNSYMCCFDSLLVHFLFSLGMDTDFTYETSKQKHFIFDILFSYKVCFPCVYLLDSCELFVFACGVMDNHFTCETKEPREKYANYFVFSCINPLELLRQLLPANSLDPKQSNSPRSSLQLRAIRQIPELPSHNFLAKTHFFSSSYVIL